MNENIFIELAIKYLNGELSDTKIDALLSKMLEHPQYLNLLITVTGIQFLNDDKNL